METLISYAHRDRALLEASILPVLKRRGVKVWMDDNVPPGETWFDWFSKKIGQMDVLTILFTDNYAESLPCDEERKWMLNARMKTRSKRLAVIWRGGALPPALETNQAIDIRTNFSKLEEKLAEVFPGGQPVAESAPRPPPIPAIHDPRDLPVLAQVNFDRRAPEYMRRLSEESMQGRNAVRLLSHYVRCRREYRWPRPHSLLDIGCGTGLVLFLMRNRSEFQALYEDASVRAGADYSRGMLELAQRYEPGYTKCFASDVKDLNPDALEKEIGCRSVGLILANNVFHWLFTRDEIGSAFKACHSIMTDGGVLAASIAGVGTGSLFLRSYKNALLGEIVDEGERQKWVEHLENPIGLQRLNELVDTARLAGFDVVDGELAYEPVRYDSTDAYVADARVYGEDVFMAPLSRHDQQARNRVWTNIKNSFRTDHYHKFHRSDYAHDQFMIYLVLRRLD